MTRISNVDYCSNPDWHYSGDVNAYHGGIWIKHEGDYCSAVRIVDLDSACGFTGAVLIERVSATIGNRKLSERKKQIKNALSCYGWTIADLAKFGRDGRRAATWNAMIDYGQCDFEEIETLQLDAEGPFSYDGWTADRRQTGGDVGGYVMAKYLD